MPTKPWCKRARLWNDSGRVDECSLTGGNEGKMGEVTPRQKAWRDGSMRNGWQSNEDKG